MFPRLVHNPQLWALDFANLAWISFRFDVIIHNFQVVGSEFVSPLQHRIGFCWNSIVVDCLPHATSRKYIASFRSIETVRVAYRRPIKYFLLVITLFK